MDFSSLRTGFNLFYWVQLGFTGFKNIFTWFQFVLLGFFGFHWVFQCFTGFLRNPLLQAQKKRKNLKKTRHSKETSFIKVKKKSEIDCKKND